MAGVHNSYTVREDRLWPEGVWLEGVIGWVYIPRVGVYGVGGEEDGGLIPSGNQIFFTDNNTEK